MFQDLGFYVALSIRHLGIENNTVRVVSSRKGSNRTDSFRIIACFAFVYPYSSEEIV